MSTPVFPQFIAKCDNESMICVTSATHSYKLEYNPTTDWYDIRGNLILLISHTDNKTNITANIYDGTNGNIKESYWLNEMFGKKTQHVRGYLTRNGFILSAKPSYDHPNFWTYISFEDKMGRCVAPRQTFFCWVTKLIVDIDGDIVCVYDYEDDYIYIYDLTKNPIKGYMVIRSSHVPISIHKEKYGVKIITNQKELFYDFEKGLMVNKPADELVDESSTGVSSIGVLVDKSTGLHAGFSG
jgi:hypothetical protein